MTEVSKESIAKIVQGALESQAVDGKLSSPIDADSSMGNPKEWDSLAFISVFMAIGEAYDIELEEDDAIHCTSVEGIYTLLTEEL